MTTLTFPPDVQMALDSNVEQVSEITEFFTGAQVMITGGSGFVGKVLVEKLLRCCPKISKIYLLLRAKRGKSPKERFKEHFEDKFFERMKREQPNYITRVELIEASIENEGLVLSPQDRELMKRSNIVFHAAATVRFDDKLRYAANINVRGTRDIFLLAKEMPNLKAIVHIGTAFSMCINKYIDEVFYKTPIAADKLLALVDMLDDASLEHLTPVLIGKWPNTYAFTKTIGEDCVLTYGKGLPACIVRPSIMIATATEPVPGWINNLYGATGVVVGAGMGLLRTLHCNKSVIADIIPADLVINNILAAAWGVGTRRITRPSRSFNAITQLSSEPNETVEYEQGAEELTNENNEERPIIYNAVSSCQNKITWGQFMSLNHTYGILQPSINIMWYYMLILNKHYWIHTLYVYVYHLFPAVIVDTALIVSGRKPMLLTIYKKIHKFMHVISYFCTQQWTFRNDNVLALWDTLSPIDKKKYYFHVGIYSWQEYFWYHIRGLRHYILKDDPDSEVATENGIKRYRKLFIAHYTAMTITSILILWLVHFLVTRVIKLTMYFIF